MLRGRDFDIDPFFGEQGVTPTLSFTGTATSSTDYSVTPPMYDLGGTFPHFQANQIEAGADELLESPFETVVVTVNAGSGYIVDPLRSSITIRIYDTPPQTSYTVNVTATDPNAAEQGSDDGTFEFTLSPAAPVGGITVWYTLSDPATNGTDYASIGSSVTFNQGETIKTVTINPTDDSVYEPKGEDVVLTLDYSSPATYNIGPDDEAVVHITDNDSVKVSVINNPSATEGQYLEFQLQLSQSVDHVVRVDYATSNGTATQPADYTQKSGNVVFNPGQTSKTVRVETKTDQLSESSETMTLSLSNAVGAVIDDGSGTGTITDLVTTSYLWIYNVIVREDEGTADFYVVLWPPNPNSKTVDYATADNSAIEPDDYTETTGTLTFAANDTVEIISVPIIDDEDREPTEDFFVNLSNAASGITILDSQGIGTIYENDVLALLRPVVCDCSCGCPTVKQSASPTAGAPVVTVGGAGQLRSAGVDPAEYPVSATVALDEDRGTPTSIAVTPIVNGTPGTTEYFDTTGVVLGQEYTSAWK